MKNQLRFIIFVIFILTLNNTTYAQWTSIGPEGGWADRVIFHPTNQNTVYASGDTHGSFYKSTDGGNTW